MTKTEVIRCSSCGSVEIERMNNNVGKCQHCGSTMLMPKQNSEVVGLLNNAYVYRENFNYDLAIKSYQYILEKDGSELAAYEGILLSEYGIEYVKDNYTGKLIPTCHRAHFTSIYDNEYYKTLISLVSDEQKVIIEDKVKEIDKLQKAIERQLKNEQEYDVFISYKATGSNGEKTEDSIIAREIYDELTNKNYRVFFAEKSLEDRVGSEYEPIIFKALHTSKIFILVGTSKENVESNWVRNEWSRFLDRIKTEDGLTKNSFIPVFKDMNPYDMPKVNNAYVQGVDAGKLGYLTTLTDGVLRLLKPEQEQKVLETFENLDNFIAFTKLQKQKQIELKTRNWKNFKQTPGIKKWFYYALIYSPTIISVIYLILCCLTESHMIHGKTFALFHVVWVLLVTLSIVALCVHAKRFKVNKWFNAIIPFTSLALGIVLFLSLYMFYPLTIEGYTAQQVASYYRSDGYFYYIFTGEYSEIEVSIQNLDRNKKYEDNIKIENGKKVFYIPKKLDSNLVHYFSALVPTDVQVLVLPQIEEHEDYRFRLDCNLIENSNIKEIYCYDVDYIDFNFISHSNSYDDLTIKVYSKEQSGKIGAYPHIALKDGGYYN